MSDFRAMEIRIFSVGHVLQQIILVLSRCRALFFCAWLEFANGTENG